METTAAPYLNHPDHKLTIVQDVTIESVVTVDGEGNLRQEHGVDVLETHEQSIWCSTCGVLSDDEYDDHGISDEWNIYC